MNKINFNHSYEKLNVCGDKAWLLQILRIHYNELSKDMKMYDTKWYGINTVGYYTIPKTDLILLIFQSIDTHSIFTTIRRWTPNKFKYYKSKEGEIFEIVVGK